MTFLNHLRIRTRLLLAILVPVLLTACALAWIAGREIRANGETELHRLENALIESRKKELKNLVTIVRDQVLAIQSDPALSDEEAREAAAAMIRSIRFDKTNYVYAYTRDAYNLAYAPDPAREGPTTDPGARKLVGELFAAAAADGFHSYIWGNPATGRDESKISYTVIIPGWDWMLGAGVYITDIEQDVAAVAGKIDTSIRNALLSALLVAVPVILLSLLVGGLVARTVGQPLRKVSDMMKDIAEGEGDLRRRLPDDGSDELAELGRRFNQFVSRIQETIRDVDRTTGELAGAAEALSSVARETRQSVDAQGSETDQIASAINEMAATIQQIAGNASDAEGAASDTDRMAREGGATIASAQEVVNQLSAEIQETARSIDALAEKSDDIQGVLDVIHTVTEQTNLLALNAAIEAARAGEHGRGFSVVADEVRQLARRSAESADQIRDMIEGFVSESRAAVERMNHSRRSSDAMVERITHATEALHAIEESVARIHDQVTQIATGAEQQTQVANEINENVVRIVEAAQRSGTGVARTNEASQDLARLGERLRSLVGQFQGVMVLECRMVHTWTHHPHNN